jgi:hypothetical protein
MPDRLETLIDHAAQLQQQLDRQAAELNTLALALLGLALGVMVLTYKLWQDQD